MPAAARTSRTPLASHRNGSAKPNRRSVTGAVALCASGAAAATLAGSMRGGVGSAVGGEDVAVMQAVVGGVGKPRKLAICQVARCLTAQYGTASRHATAETTTPRSSRSACATRHRGHLALPAAVGRYLAPKAWSIACARSRCKSCADSSPTEKRTKVPADKCAGARLRMLAMSYGTTRLIGPPQL